MKGLLLGITIGFLSINLNAQINKGTVLLGGSGSYRLSNSTEDYSLERNYIIAENRYETYSIRPYVGVFSSKSTMMGIGLGYESSKLTQTINESNGVTYDYNEEGILFYINPFIEKYVQIKDNLYYTTNFNFLAGFGKNERLNRESLSVNISEIRFNVTPGLAYFVSEKWVVKGSFGRLAYNKRKETLPTGSSIRPVALENVSTNFGVDLGWNTFTIAVQYLIISKK